MRLMISALLLASAAVTAPALAQDHDRGDHGDWHRGGGGQQGGGDHRGNPGGGGGQRPAPAPQAQAPQATPAPQPGRPPQGGGFGQGWNGRPDHAQPNPQWHGQPNNFGQQGGGNPAAMRPRDGAWAGNRDDHGRPGGWAGRPGGGRPDAGRPDVGRPDAGRPDVGRDNRDHDGWAGRPGGWNPGRPGNDGDHGRPGGNWNRGWRDNHREAYRVGRYRPPYGYGWGYRRFGVGMRLDAVLFAPSYWIADPWNYRLPPAYGPYRWVRYYNDALLVDIETGFVIDEIPDFFW